MATTVPWNDGGVRVGSERAWVRSIGLEAGDGERAAAVSPGLTGPLGAPAPQPAPMSPATTPNATNRLAAPPDPWSELMA